MLDNLVLIQALGMQTQQYNFQLNNCNSHQLQNQYLYNLTSIGVYHTQEEDILSYSYIRREWDTEFCRVMFWTPTELALALDHIKDAQTSNNSNTLLSSIPN